MSSNSASPAASSTTAKKPQRVLACILCQQRKVKCDRKFPCANCTKANAQCIPAALIPRVRRKRFPERELLDRLRRYEDLLRKHNIDFEPLHGPSTSNSAGGFDYHGGDSDDDGGEDNAAATSTIKQEPIDDDSPKLAKSYWKAMSHRSQRTDTEVHVLDEDSSPDDVQEKVITTLLDEHYANDDQLFFGSKSGSVDLSTLHPEQSRIFKLWQIYLENIDPMIKITHTPTLQARIIDATGNLATIEPSLEALMFGIYCAAVTTLTDAECQAQFGITQKSLLTSYQFGCREALLNANVSRSTEVETLRAFLLYLISAKQNMDPRSLFSMLGVAIRLAKRIGIHIEALNVKHHALEAELRRRLWWALTMFDERLSEMSGYKDAALMPTWDCKIPSNLNDFDLSADVIDTPASRKDITEAIFPVVRAEIGNFVRRTLFHLDFTNPILKTLINDVQHGPIRRAGTMADLKRMLEERYLKQCNPAIPLQLMTLMCTKCFLAKKCAMELYSTIPEKQTEDQKDLAVTFAMEMLDSDTAMSKSPLTKRFAWYTVLHFPFPAYVHIVHDLRRRPGSKVADQAWETLRTNYESRFADPEQEHGMFFSVFPRAVLAAWRARKAHLERNGFQAVPPSIITSILLTTAQMGISVLNTEPTQESTTPDPLTDSSTPDSMFDMSSDGSLANFGSFGMLPANFWDLSQPMDLDGTQMSWPGMNWAPLVSPVAPAVVPPTYSWP